MNVTATEAKNRLGQVLEQAQSKPVFIEKAGRRHSVVLSNERYEQLLKAEAGESLAERKRRFNEQYKDWIAEQNARFVKHGLWNEEFRRW
ncbi:MAG: type II toxin-antitoxin system prevent-host-death family antitoxin [Caldimonas sp.]